MNESCSYCEYEHVFFFLVSMIGMLVLMWMCFRSIAVNNEHKIDQYFIFLEIWVSVAQIRLARNQ